MKTIIKTTVLGAAFVLMLMGDLQLAPTLRVGLFSEAHAIAGVRRRTARRTAVVVSSADASADAAAQQQAAAAEQPADATAQAAPAPAAAAPGALPLGTVVDSLPEGCTGEAIAGVEYQHCGADYYRAVFQANNLVYVTAQP